MADDPAAGTARHRSCPIDGAADARGLYRRRARALRRHAAGFGRHARTHARAAALRRSPGGRGAGLSPDRGRPLWQTRHERGRRARGDRRGGRCLRGRARDPVMQFGGDGHRRRQTAAPAGAPAHRQCQGRILSDRHRGACQERWRRLRLCRGAGRGTARREFARRSGAGRGRGATNPPRPRHGRGRHSHRHPRQCGFATTP